MQCVLHCLQLNLEANPTSKSIKALLLMHTIAKILGMCLNRFTKIYTYLLY